MPRVKQASKHARTTKAAAATVLGTAGLGLSLVGSASREPRYPLPISRNLDNIPPNQRFVLGEEEMADVSLATFHLFDMEIDRSDVQQLAVIVVRRGCGGCRGCRGCRRGCAVRGCGGCAGCVVGGCCARWGRCRICVGSATWRMNDKTWTNCRAGISARRSAIFSASLIGSVWQILKRSRRSTIGQRRCFCGCGLLRLAQAAIELQDVGDVLGDLVAGAVAADDDAHGDAPAGATGASIARNLGIWMTPRAPAAPRPFGIPRVGACQAASVTARIFRCTPVSSRNAGR